MCKCGVHVSVYTCVYVYICVYVNTFVHVYMHVEVQSWYCHHLQWLFPFNLSIKPRACQLTRLDSHQAWGSIISTFQARNNRKATIIFPGTCMVLRDLNSGLHVSVISTLTTEQEQFHSSMHSSLHVVWYLLVLIGSLGRHWEKPKNKKFLNFKWYFVLGITNHGFYFIMH